MTKEIELNVALVVLLLVGIISILGTAAIITNAARGPVVTGYASTIYGWVTVIVQNATDITIENNSIAFGTVTPGSTNETVRCAWSEANECREPEPQSGRQTPFVIRNDGNIWIDINISATNLWSSTTGNLTGPRYMVNSSAIAQGNGTNITLESGNTSFQAGCTGVSATNASSCDHQWDYMPGNSSGLIIVRGLNFTNGSDKIMININITAPGPYDGEPSGSKNSTVTFTAFATTGEA